MLNRRTWLKFSAAALAVSRARAANDPWPASDLLAPGELAEQLNTARERPEILCVAFPVLYRQRRIVHAEFAGPAGSPEGLAKLKSAAAALAKDRPIVIYCGCCPMVKCPNVRPAYKALKDAGFTDVRVLNLPTNFHDDWVAKGFPVEEQVGVPDR